MMTVTRACLEGQQQYKAAKRWQIIAEYTFEEDNRCTENKADNDTNVLVRLLSKCYL